MEAVESNEVREAKREASMGLIVEPSMEVVGAFT